MFVRVGVRVHVCLLPVRARVRVRVRLRVLARARGCMERSTTAADLLVANTSLRNGGRRVQNRLPESFRVLRSHCRL